MSERDPGMNVLASAGSVAGMGERTVVAIAEGPVTRLGQLVLAGEVIDDEPIMPSTLRVMDAYVLSVVIDGEGSYRDADGRDEPIRPGAHTIVPPGFPHTYGTDPGRAVDGTVRRLHRTAVRLARRPRHPGRPARATRVPPPSIEALRTVLRTPPRTSHGPPSTSCWRWPTGCSTPRTPTSQSPTVSTEIADAVDRLADDLTATHGPAAVAAEVGAELRHVPAPVHRAGRPVAGRVPQRAAAADGRDAAAGDRHDPPRDRADPRFRRRVPPVAPVPGPLRRLARATTAVPEPPRPVWGWPPAASGCKGPWPRR